MAVETEARKAPAGDLLRRDASFAPETWDPDTRTIEVVWTTGADVRRYDWWTERYYLERLVVSDDAVDMTRLGSGAAPVLDSHQRWGLDTQIGVVQRAWLENGTGKAVLRFGEREEIQGLIRDIASGVIRNISVGYTYEPDQVRVTPDPTKKEPELRELLRWQPFELSFVAVPADAGSGTRGMPAPGPASLPTPPAPPAHHEDIRMSGSNPAGNPPANTPPVNEAPNADAIRAEAAKAERSRIAGIHSACRTLGLQEQAEKLVEEGISVETAQSRLIAELEARAKVAGGPDPSSRPRVGASGDDPAEVRAAMATAIAVRTMPGLAQGQESMRYREFLRMRPSDMLMELAHLRGERVSPRDRQDFLERSFHTSSDFPLLLENAGNKMLEAGMALANPSYRRIFAYRPFNDFKAHSFLTAGDFPALEELGEGGAIKDGTISEKRERVTAKTYAKAIAVTRQMLVNDDLGAFTDFGSMIGRRVADFENAMAYAQLGANSGAGPTLAEGNTTLFATTRGNRAASGAAISETTLDAAYAGIIEHTSLDGLKLNLRPSILLTGSAYRGAALRYTRQIVATEAGKVALYTDLEPIVDANVTGNRWYLFPEPGAAPTFVYGYVNGQSAPQIRVHNPIPGRDGMQVEVVHDFAVGAIGWRGAWFNQGA
ncbi:terminase [Rhodovarius crocodyli]|uniref:Terminase n=1 Tax=Rhodovarius crocodyli TaxID=1979269 RepID=A0A437MJU6_9PROT|nr:prohead protease/major capsid protein fusion protein [Rhodovarius crocodyli]RVT97903.1 terminase [Rhodovarius crocodyli]